MRLVLLIIISILYSSCDNKKHIAQDTLICKIIEEYVPLRVPFIPLPEEQKSNLDDKKLLLCSFLSYNFFSELDIEIYSNYMKDSFLIKNNLDEIDYMISTHKTNCSTDLNIELLSEKQFIHYRQGDLNNALKENKADALLMLSPPIISDDGSSASALILFYCGSLCGSVELVSLSKVNSKWIIDKIKTISIS